MAGLTVQNFVSAAVGMAVWRRSSAASPAASTGRWATSGSTSCGHVYILLPLAIVVALVLGSQGVLADVHGHAVAHTARGRAPSRSTAARSPRRIAIKQLGTNGGGFYNSNSAVPFENPNRLTNFLEVLCILLIPARLTSTCSG